MRWKEKRKGEVSDTHPDQKKEKKKKEIKTIVRCQNSLPNVQQYDPIDEQTAQPCDDGNRIAERPYEVRVGNKMK